MLRMVKRLQLTDPRRDTKEKVRQFQAKGLGPSQIALLLGISRQRVHQHLKAIREEVSV